MIQPAECKKTMRDSENIQISVIITFFNQRELVSTCLSSVLNQKTDFAFEILCGDDCSDDGTYEELLDWAEKYPDIIHVHRTDGAVNTNEPIVRASNNRYNLLSHANGRYICFLDGDDYYCDEYKLQKQFNVLNSNSTLSCCFHPLIMRWADGIQPDKVLCNYSDNLAVIPAKSYWGCLWAHVETFMFRNIFSEIKEKINKDFFDDNLITAYFIGNDSIYFIPEPMCVYMQFQNSSWNSRSDLEKSYINIMVLQESKRVLSDYKFQCFTKCYDDIRFLYDNRRADWNIFPGSKLVLTEPIYIDTLRYKNANFIYKSLYILKWFFPIYVGRRLKNLNYRLNMHYWKSK